MLQAEYFLNKYQIQLDAGASTPEKLRRLKEAFCVHESYDGDAPYIFVSYAHRDSALVLPAIKAIQEQGYPVWYDAGIRPGTEWAADISKHLMKASLVLAFVSEAAFNSQHCRSEIAHAFNNNKPMLTICLDQSPLPAGLDMQLSLSQMFDAYAYDDGDTYVSQLARASILAEKLNPAAANAPVSKELLMQQPAQPKHDHYVQSDFELGKSYAQRGELEKALEYFRKAAAEHHVQAQFEVGYAYFDGRGTKTDYEQAKIWLEKAAWQGHTEGQYLLSCILTVDGQEAEAVNWLQKAADGGHMDAKLALATCYENGTGFAQDYAEAAKLVQQGVQRGVPRTYAWMARLYLSGKGVEKDAQKAVQLLRQGANMTVKEAQCLLGECLEQGEGTDKDLQQANYWYKKAADQGDANACYRLGRMYEFGVGVEKDAKEAGNWFRKAQENELHDHKMTWDEYDLASTESAQFHYEIAMLDAPKDTIKITSDYIDEYQPLSRDLYIAAKRGHIKAQIALGARYYAYYRTLWWGDEDSHEFETEAEEWRFFDECLEGMRKGIAWIEKAAQQGIAEAQRTLAGHYFNLSEYVYGNYLSDYCDFDGKPDPSVEKYATEREDYTKRSHYWMRKAAQQEDAEALYEMAFYEPANGVKWLQMAADNGHIKACEELAWRYKNGDGVKKSNLMANMYDRKAKKLRK